MLRIKLNEKGEIELQEIITSVTRKKKRRANKKQEATSLIASKKTSERLIKTPSDDLLNEIMDNIMELYMELEDET